MVRRRVRGMFTGLSSTSTGPAAAQRALLDLIDGQDARNTLERAESLEDLRVVSAPLRNAIDDYLDNWGLRAIRYEVAYPMVAERPEWLLRQLQEQGGRATRTIPRRTQLHERRPSGGCSPTWVTPRRLARGWRPRVTRSLSAKAMRRPRSGFLSPPCATSGSRRVVASPVSPISNDRTMSSISRSTRSPRPCAAPRTRPADPTFARRTDEARLAADATPPPRTVGPPADAAAGPPSLTGFPPAIVEGTRAMLWYTDKVFGDPPPATDANAPTNEIRGTAVSPGRYEGTARVLLDERGSSASNRATCSCARSPHRSGRWCSPRSVHSCAMPAGR